MESLYHLQRVRFACGSPSHGSVYWLLTCGEPRLDRVERAYVLSQADVESLLADVGTQTTAGEAIDRPPRASSALQVDGTVARLQQIVRENEDPAVVGACRVAADLLRAAATGTPLFTDGRLE